MLLGEKMAKGGDRLFRWRSYVLLIFAPLMLLSFPQGEVVERLVGDPWDNRYEFVAIAIVAIGLVLRAFTVGFVPAGTSGRITTGSCLGAYTTGSIRHKNLSIGK